MAALPFAARFAKALVFCTLILVFLGGLVTTTQSGMAVPDWPLSFGSLNPEGWWGNLPVRLEHGHRLFAGFVGMLVAALGVVIWVSPALRPYRGLAMAAFIGVVLQAVLGGLRVTLGGPEHSVAPMILRIVHGCIAQAELGLLVSLAALLSPAWRNPALLGAASQGSLRLHAWIAAGAIFFQLIFGAIMRHLGAGLAIPTFPEADPSGSWMPRVHNALVDVNFTHTRFGALLVTLLVVSLAVRVLRAHRGVPLLVRPAWIILGLLTLQLGLGVFVIWHFKPVVPTTLHVVNGALLLSTTLLLALRLRRARGGEGAEAGEAHAFAGVTLGGNV